MADEIGQVYRPAEIQETPFPQQGVSDYAVNQSTSSGGQSYKPAETKEQTFPAKQHSVDVIGQALNTRTRKILGSYEFTPSGAIRIGDYTQGESGDISISPDGIVARNVGGVQTFALDGDTGDAVFAGQIQTGSIVSGLALLGDGSIEIDGLNKRMVFYENGIPVIVIGNV